LKPRDRLPQRQEPSLTCGTGRRLRRVHITVKRSDNRPKLPRESRTIPRRRTSRNSRGAPPCCRALAGGGGLGCHGGCPFWWWPVALCCRRRYIVACPGQIGQVKQASPVIH